jgi:hypothetical protein
MTPHPPLEIVSDSYDGSTRVLELRYCVIPSCSAPFYAPKHINKKYCCTTCSGVASRVRVTLSCDWCGKKFETSPGKLKRSRKDLHFCSRYCKDTAQRIGGLSDLHPPHYGTGTGEGTNYREQAFRIYGARCGSCGYSEDSRMLDVHHIDSDRKNNSIRNWQVLCVWCHALKTRGVPEHNWVGKYGVIV